MGGFAVPLAAGAAASPDVRHGISSLFSPGQPQALVPQDLRGLRSQQIQLLQQLLGFPGGPGAAPSPSTPSDPLQRLQQFFGPLSPFSSGAPGGTTQFGGGLVNMTDTQRGSTGVSQFLNQPSPEQRAMDVAMPGLQEILSGGGPQFERDLSLANQQGGRFGSANAILRGEALRNLYNTRGQAAQTLGLLAQGAGGGQARQAGFADLETQRRLQMLLNLLGVAQQASFNVPTAQTPSPFSQLAGIASTILPLLAGG